MSKKKKWILVAAVSAGAVALVVWGISSFISSRLAVMQGSYETATVSADVIETTVVGTGTLAYGDAEDVSLPSGVDVTSVFYENGQRVAAGDLLAAVDTESLGLLMSETYSQISEVDTKLRDTPSEPEKVVVTSPVAGRVQAIYAANGASVLETISASGSLMLISPDGRMQVEVETDSLPDVGSEVKLVLPDGGTKTARVDNVRSGVFTASLTDASLDEGLSVRVQSADGTELGSGMLKSTDAVSVIGPAGTVEGITVSVGSEVKVGTDLFSVRSSSPPATYQELDRQRRTLTERYDALASLYEKGGLASPVSGVVTSCSISEGTNGSESSAGSVSDALGSLPAGVLSAFGMERRTRGEVTDVLGLQQGGENMMLEAEAPGDEPEEPAEPTEEPSEPSSEPAPPSSAPSQPADVSRAIPRLSVPLLPPVPGLPLQHSIDLLPLCTGEVSWDPADEQAQPGTAYTVSGVIQALEGFHFADDCTLSVPLGEVTSCSVADGGSTLSFTAAYEKTMEGLGSIDWEAIKEVLGLDSIDLSTLRDLLSAGILDAGSLGFDLSGLTSGFDFSGLTGLSGLDASALAGLDASALAGLDAGALAGAALSDSLQNSSSGEIPAYTIASDDSMQLLIQINQMDVLSVEPGMRCTVTVDALEGQEFDGTVSDIAAADTSGSGTYTATITLSKTADMRSGMSASAVIVTSATEGEMTLPAAAVQEDGTRVFVYTSYDRGSDTFGGEKEITTGVSDGANVQVLSGLEPGETVYYARASALERMMESMGGPRSRSSEDGQVQITVDANSQ